MSEEPGLNEGMNMTEHVNCDNRKPYKFLVIDAISRQIGSIFDVESLKEEIARLSAAHGAADATHWQIVLSVLEDRGCLRIHRPDDVAHHSHYFMSVDLFEIVAPSKPVVQPRFKVGDLVLMDSELLMRVDRIVEDNVFYVGVCEDGTEVFFGDGAYVTCINDLITTLDRLRGTTNLVWG